MSLPVFWGLHLSPNKKVTPEIENNIRITTVSFGQKVQKDSRSAVVLNIDDKEFVICVLAESRTESISCEVIVPGDSNPTFRVTGNNDVYLTGHYIYPEEYEDSDDSENDALEQLYGSDLSDDDDDDEFEGEESEDDLLEGKDIDDDSDEEDEDDLIIQQELQKAASKKNENKSGNKKAPVVSKQVDQPKESKIEKNENPSKPTKIDSKPEPNTKRADNNNKRKNEIETSSNKKNKAVPTPINKEPVTEPKSSTKVLPSGLKIEDRVVGTGQEAKRNNRVLVRYVGRLKNGKIFDQNSSGAPFAFRLGAGEVIKGWDQGVLGMRIGGQRKLTIPAPLAYGSRGAPPDIPKNAELTFEIKLMGIK